MKMREDQYHIGCDWFEGTFWPRMPIDLFVEELFSAIWPLGNYRDSAFWSTRGWQGYDRRVSLGENLVTVFYRSQHCLSSIRRVDDPSADVSGRSIQIGADGEDQADTVDYYDVHIIFSGSGLRLMGDDGFKSFLRWVRFDGYEFEEGKLPLFKYEFVPTRVDVSFDFFDPTEEITDLLIAAFRHESGYQYGRNQAPVYRVSSRFKFSNLEIRENGPSTNITFGTRGHGSSCYFRLYDKKWEQEKTNGPLKDKYDYWQRLEYETRYCVALNIAALLVYRFDARAAFWYVSDRMFTPVWNHYSGDNAKAHNPVVDLWRDFLEFISKPVTGISVKIVKQPYEIIDLVEYDRRVRSKMSLFYLWLCDPVRVMSSPALRSRFADLRGDPKYTLVIARIALEGLSDAEITEIEKSGLHVVDKYRFSREFEF